MSLFAKGAKLRKAKQQREVKERRLQYKVDHGGPETLDDMPEHPHLRELVLQAERLHEFASNPGEIVKQDQPGYVGKHVVYKMLHMMWRLVDAVKELDAKPKSDPLQREDLWKAVRAVARQPVYRKAVKHWLKCGHVAGQQFKDELAIERKLNAPKVKGRIGPA